MEITIRGAQGCGKTRLAQQIITILEAGSKRVICYEGDDISHKTGKCRKFDVIIQTEQTQ